MADELVGCICSSLAGLMGAVGDAVAAANGLGAPSDVIPAGAGGDAADAGAAGGEGGDQQAAGGLSPTHIASLLLLILAIFLSALRRSLGILRGTTMPGLLLLHKQQQRLMLQEQQPVLRQEL
ncbi:hypothetical protein ACSSS7_003686 [Eimeria intestinalis]